MKCALISAAVYGSEAVARKKLWIFLESCRTRGGVDPLLYGLDSSWTLYRHIKLDMQLEFLKSDALASYTHVCYHDAGDGFFVGSFQELLNKYAQMGRPSILVSASHKLANVSDERERYGNAFDSPEKYRYLHCGAYIAERDAIIAAFEKMLTNPAATSDDCFDWQQGWVEGWFRPTLDSQCEIFQVTTEDCETHYTATASRKVNAGDPVFGVATKRVLNKHTGSLPVLMHCAGGWSSPEFLKDDRIAPYARSIGVIE